VRPDIDAVNGGAYALLIRQRNFGTLQFEAESWGTLGGNDAFEDAEPIEPGVIYGFHEDDEADEDGSPEFDYFSFTVDENDLAYFELIAHRNGTYLQDIGYYDTYLELFDTDGETSLNAVDDCYYYDSCIARLISTPGTYYVAVYACCGDGSSPYFLIFNKQHLSPVVETENNNNSGSADLIAYGDSVAGSVTLSTDESDWFKFEGTAGDMVNLQVLDSVLYEDAQNNVAVVLVKPDGATEMTSGGDAEIGLLTTILQATGTYYVHVARGAQDTSYVLRLNRFKGAAYEAEPNDSRGNAGSLDANGRAAGLLTAVDTEDYFEFYALGGELVTFAMYQCACGTLGNDQTGGWGSELAGILTVLDAEESVLATTGSNYFYYAEGTGTDSPDLMLSFVAPESGTFYVRITMVTEGEEPDTYYYVLERR